ncbi:MAG: DNA-protecting protein DprA, partial [Candidatus Peregrinibacteria bacterium]|nr:DNA-protecting protein DprA [Candidatus Peregrinibacteria bacterium]
DVLAQKCAVGHGARTISILGNGIDQICPATNRSFGEKVLSENKGAILSEYLPGVDARPEYFPVRNRIVAALSKATIAIEAAEKSGSLITCNLAIDFGKEVFAVPGEIFSPNSKGTNGLILKGVAAPAVSGQQILEYLGLKNIEQQKKAKMNVPEVGIEADILQLFGNEKMHIDDLIRVAKFPGNVVSSTVSILEIKGYVVNLGGQVYAVS